MRVRWWFKPKRVVKAICEKAESPDEVCITGQPKAAAMDAKGLSQSITDETRKMVNYACTG
jgi:hypothetical protein